MRLSSAVKAVPWQVWAVLGVSLTAAYLARRAASGAGDLLRDAAGAVADVSVGALKAASLPLAVVAGAAQVATRPAVESEAGAVVADAVFGAGAAVADAMQSMPGVIDALDTVFGAFDRVAGIFINESNQNQGQPR